jgi:hypothetical protein
MISSHILCLFSYCWSRIQPPTEKERGGREGESGEDIVGVVGVAIDERERGLWINGRDGAGER